MHNDIYSSLFIVSVSKSKRLETSQSCFSCVQLFASLWTVASQALLSVGFPRQEYWSGLPFPSPGHLPWPRDQTCVSCLVRWILYPCATWEAHFRGALQIQDGISAWPLIWYILCPQAEFRHKIGCGDARILPESAWTHFSCGLFLYQRYDMGVGAETLGSQRPWFESHHWLAVWPWAKLKFNFLIWKMAIYNLPRFKKKKEKKTHRIVWKNLWDNI